MHMEVETPGGTRERFPSFLEAIRADVYGCGKPFKAIAADLDMTSSELSRKLANNPADPVHFPAALLPDLLRATGGRNALHWLIESFCETPEARRTRAVAELSALLPHVAELLRTAGSPPPTPAHR